MAVGNGNESQAQQNIASTGMHLSGCSPTQSPGDAEVRTTKLFKQVAPGVATKQAFLRNGEDPATIELIMVREDGAAEVYPVSIGLRAHFLNVISQAMNHEAARLWGKK